MASCPPVGFIESYPSESLLLQHGMHGMAAGRFGAGPAAAQQSFSLTWQAPEGCPSHAQVEEEIARALSHLTGKGPVEVVAELKQVICVKG